MTPPAPAAVTNVAIHIAAGLLREHPVVAQTIPRLHFIAVALKKPEFAFATAA